jgi:hypothetical protein
MKSEQIKEITDRAAEQLVASLERGHSETLTEYLKAIGRFHHYSRQSLSQRMKSRRHWRRRLGRRSWSIKAISLKNWCLQSWN